MRQMRDPAPSRLAYKLNRLMLRRGVRSFLRYGLPILMMSAIAAWWASDELRREDAKDRVAEMRRQIQERPEFMVRMMAVEDVSPGVAQDIRTLLSMDFPTSSFDVDLKAVQKNVETLDAVASASVRIRTGGVLEITVDERVPVAVWRLDDALQLIDLDGHRVDHLSARADRPDLPLLVGEGANQGVSEAIALYSASTPISERVRGLVRVGERRWDIVLDRGQRIMLPELRPVTSLEKVIALDHAQDLLARDIAAVDFRNPHRPVLRLTETALSVLRGTGEDEDEREIAE